MINMKLIKLFGIAVLFLGLDALGQSPQSTMKTKSSDTWKTFAFNNYSIQYPDSFDLNKSGLMGTCFVLLSKQTSQGDLFRENVNLIIQDLTGKNIGLDKYVAITEGQIKSRMSNGIIIESKRINAGDSEFHKIIYSGTQGQFNLKFEQYYWIIKEKAYVLTLTCELNQFDKYKEVGEKIMNSFRVK